MISFALHAVYFRRDIIIYSAFQRELAGQPGAMQWPADDDRMHQPVPSLAPLFIFDECSLLMIIRKQRVRCRYRKRRRRRADARHAQYLAERLRYALQRR